MPNIVVISGEAVGFVIIRSASPNVFESVLPDFMSFVDSFELTQQFSPPQCTKTKRGVGESIILVSVRNRELFVGCCLHAVNIKPMHNVLLIKIQNTKATHADLDWWKRNGCKYTGEVE